MDRFRGGQLPRILVVDDDPRYSRFLSQHLKACGLDSVRVGSGQDAIRLCADDKPDLILLDWFLGDGLSGHDTLKALKRHHGTSKVPVIVVSGLRPSTEDRREALRIGADLFLDKTKIGERPLSEKPLLRHIEALLPMRAFVTAKGKPDAVVTGELSDDASETGYQHTILVVDDEPETSELLRVALRAMNCRILWATTGAQGLRLAASEMPDLAVLDLNMPGIDGREVCRRLREQERTFSLPILILTGDPRIKQEAACFGIGADDYLVKTTPPLRLQARIRRMLWRHRFQADARGVIRVSEARLNMKTHQFSLPDSTDIHLTPIESAFCALLMGASGNLVPHNVIFKKLYSAWPELGSEKLRKHVSNLKHKLGRFSDLIESVRSEGYRFNSEYAQRTAANAKPAGDTR